MSGTGSLTKTGAGTLTLTGTSTISGQASIQAGTLNVAQQLSTGGLFVRSGGTLAGSGTLIGNVTVESGGTLAPGNSPGTLSVAGNVTFSAGSTFAAEIDGATYSAAGGAGSYDRLVVSGTATLGGTVSPILRAITAPANNNYTPNIGDAFTVITANNVVGNFSSVLQPAGLAANTRFDVLYSANNVKIVITPGSFATLGTSDGWRQNSINAATGLDAVRPTAGTRSGNLQSLFNGLYGLNHQQLNTTLTQLSGEIYAHSLQSLTGAERSIFASMMHSTCNIGCSRGPEEVSGEVLWGRIVGDHSNHSADRISSGFAANQKGVVFGSTPTSHDDISIGVAGSYTENRVRTSTLSMSKSAAVGGYLYLSYKPSSSFNFSGSFGVSLSNTNIRRNIQTTVSVVEASSKRRGITVMAGGRASYRAFVDNAISLWGDASLELYNTSMGRLSELSSHPDYALIVGKVNRLSAETYLGGRLRLEDDQTCLDISAGWAYEHGEDPAVNRSLELGNAKWRVSSVDYGRSAVRLGVRSSALLSDRLRLFSLYQYTQHGDGYRYGRAAVGVDFLF